MQTIITPMSKALSEIDQVYGSIYQKMTTREKISYCEILITTMQSSLNRNAKTIHLSDKKRTNEIIVAAKAELKKLTATAD